jgi:hypothetical protein
VKNRFTILALFAIIVAGCSEKESPMSCNYDKELEAFSDKLDVWSNELTTARCEEMRTSAFAVLQKIKGCPGTVSTEEAMQGWREVDCSSFDIFLGEYSNLIKND